MKHLFLAVVMSLCLPTASVTCEIIPREKLFTKPHCLAVKISPDEKRLAYVGGDPNGAMNIFVSDDLTINGRKATHFTVPEIRAFHWSQDGKKILFLKDTDGTSLYRLYVLDATTFELKELTDKFEKISAKIYQMSSKANKAVVGISGRNPKFYDLYIADLDSGTLMPLYKNESYIQFLFDDNLHIVLKAKLGDDASVTFFDKNEREFAYFSPEDAFNSECISYSGRDNAIYMLDTRTSNTTVLKKVSLGEKKRETFLGNDLKSDIADVLFEGDAPIAYATYFTENSWHPLTKKAAEELQFLNAKLGRNYSIANQKKDGKLWLITTHSPENGSAIWLYERGTKKLNQLFSYPNIANLAKMYPLVIPSQDGKELVCYLTLPREVDMGGRPEKPLPLVVVPHGGPFEARDYYAYSPFHQWLQSRGYAVLSVNFRLSSGFGKDFVNAGNGEWGRNAHRDIVDAVDYCIQNKIAEKGKIAVWGISYGGYEALASLVFSPEKFACTVAICGPSNLKTVLEKTPYYWELPVGPCADKQACFSTNAFYVSMGGNPHTKEGLALLEERSPINHVDAIERPLLLVHGVNDPIVSASESDRIFACMKEKKLPVLYLSFPDEGHGIDKFANSMVYLAYSEWLFSHLLDGKYEPLAKEDVEKSSVKIQSYGLPIDAVIKNEAP